MRVMFMYNDEDPPRGLVTPGPLPNPEEAWRTHKSVLLLQKSPLYLPHYEPSARVLELRNQEVELPYGDDSLLWCKLFKLDKLDKKHHIVKVIIRVFTQFRLTNYTYSLSTNPYLIRHGVITICNKLLCMNVRPLVAKSRSYRAMLAICVWALAVYHWVAMLL